MKRGGEERWVGGGGGGQTPRTKVDVQDDAGVIGHEDAVNQLGVVHSAVTLAPRFKR